MTVPGLERVRSALADRYVVERLLGSGAMASVYLARDIKHRREVAVKVLHPELAAALGPERFLREVHTLAHLHHPHILPLFDSGQADGCLYYVMPRVEGESLRDRLSREHQLPVDEALQITREVAAALDYAHRHHIIHRDIKPANILLQDGQALIADFGIALAMSVAGDRITETGLSVGTPWYMSPEQAAGDRDLDARSDVFSLAAVLYEMLTGEPPHTGRDAQAVLAKVITEPARPVRALRPTVPAHVEGALQKALAKIPADRFPSTASFARALSPLDVAAAIAPPQGRRRIKWTVVAGVSAWLVLAMAFVIATWTWRGSRMPANNEATGVRRWSIVLPDSAPLAFVGTAPLGVGRIALSISPDGTRLVYVARRGRTTQLYLLELDKLDATPMPGTIGANQPFFSPDGGWIGFFVGRELKKVSVRGDQPVTLAQVTEPYGAAWAPDGRILVLERQGGRPVWVSSSGGQPQPIERQLEIRVFSPQIIDGGQWILHSSIDGLYLHSLATGWPYAITRDGVVRRDSVQIDALLYGANPRYLTSGHIAYFSAEGTLMALPFDMSRRRVLGPPAPIAEGIRLESEAGDAQLSVSRDGTLVYAPGESARLGRFVWVEHAGGRIDTLPWPRAAYGGFDLSPDGRQVLVRIRSAAGRGELWTLDVDGGTRARVPTEGILVSSPRWWPDGARLMYYELPPDGGRAGTVTVLQSLRNPAERDTLPLGTLAPGREASDLIQFERGLLWLVSAEQPTRRAQLTRTGRGGAPEISPDGQWLVYMDLDDPGGESAVYATRVGDPADRHKISSSGGEEPVWTSDGKTVIYRDRQEWFAVDVSTTGAFRAGRPRLLFQGPFLQVPGASHDVARDGRRQLVLLGPTGETTHRLVVVTNWFAEVQRLAASREE